MENNRAVVKVEGKDDFLPILTVDEAIRRRQQILEYTNRILEEGKDYGVIPGTGKDGNGKLTLLKPGAEKLCTVFGLAPHFDIVTRIEDWTGKDHGGEMFFYYLVKCKLYRGDRILAEGDGSCNSWESRYRWRNANRDCPQCGQAKIIRGKAEYGGGWLCYKKTGGCGAKYADGDQAIESQPQGKVKNPDMADIVNTVLKMAEKRALISAALIATNASDSFTQDVEDAHIIDAEYEERPTPSPRQEPPSKPHTNGNAKKPPANGVELHAMIEQMAADWEKKGYCKKAGEVWVHLADFAKRRNLLTPINDWPKELFPDVKLFLSELLIKLKEDMQRKPKPAKETVPAREPGDDGPDDGIEF